MQTNYATCDALEALAPLSTSDQIASTALDDALSGASLFALFEHYPASLDDAWVEIRKKTPFQKFRDKDRWQSCYRRIGDLCSRPKFHAEWIAGLGIKGWTVYFMRNPVVAPKGTRKTKASNALDVATIVSFALDLDGIDPVLALWLLRKAGLPEPSIAISTGHGIHAHWFLDMPISRLGGQGLLNHFVDRYARHPDLMNPNGKSYTDKKVCDPARILKVPGSVNFKDWDWKREDRALTEGHVAQVLVNNPGLKYALKSLVEGMTEEEEQALRAEEDERMKVQVLMRQDLSGYLKAVLAVTDPRVPSPPSTCPSGTFENVEELQPKELGFQKIPTNREVVVSLRVDPGCQRIHDPDFQAHIQSVVKRVMPPTKGERNLAIAFFAAALRPTYSGKASLTLEEAIYAHDLFIVPYRGDTPIEVSRGEFVYAYRTMGWGKTKEQWIAEIREHEEPHPQEHLLNQGKRGTSARKLASFIWSACLQKEGQVQLAERTAAVVIGRTKRAASKTIDRLVELGLIKRVYLGNRLTGRGTEFRCPLLDERNGVGGDGVEMLRRR